MGDATPPLFGADLLSAMLSHIVMEHVRKPWYWHENVVVEGIDFPLAVHPANSQSPPYKRGSL